MAATEIQREAHCACALCQVPSVEKLPTFLATIALQCCKLNSIPKGEAETSPKGTGTLYHKSRAVRERPLIGPQIPIRGHAVDFVAVLPPKWK